MKLQYKILQFYPVFWFYFPTIRLGTIPVRFEDLLCVLIFFSLASFSRIKIEKSYIYYVAMFSLMLMLILSSSIEYNDNLNLKGVIVGFSFIKYILWFVVARQTSVSDSNDSFSLVFFSVLKWCFLSQLIIIVFQKYDILGFASGPFFQFVVKFYSIPNIYSTSTDIESLISTHMNFSFRPAGTFGSSTVTGLSMYIAGSVLFLKYKNIAFKVFGYFAALICFSKIALVAAIFCDFILPMFLKFKLKNLLLATVISPFLVVGIYVSMDILGVLHNFYGAIDGTDRGVTHRLTVINYMFNMSVKEWLWGNLGTLPFGFFDSGTLLSIFRYGIVFYFLEYLIFYLLFKKITDEKLISMCFVFYILFADLTFGSVFNPVFSSAIFFLLLACATEGLRRKK
ncbi:hypothetical protein [Aliivibrio sp. EL58]|uniref:hypothetical protein n=1 Tax=Aliivibrio sp. EL58 TaxID=2107582 RepID=UPI000EFD4C8A|nr:hypothetical protein [Aliivibrio sp. EL58]